jgi:arylsulfatase A-like enzyme
VLRRLEPAFLMINFSDVEVAHFGVYSAHVAGIRRTDALCHRLWSLLQSLPAYAEKTTLVIMPEFGRDPDGSTTNGFFNHRTNTEENRVTWMMVLGQAVRKPAVVEKPVRHIDVAPSLGAFLGVECKQSTGEMLPEFRA